MQFLKLTCQTHPIRLSYTQEDHPRFRLAFYLLYTSETSLLNKKTGEFKFVDQPELNQFGFKDDFEGGPAFWPVYISEDDYMIAMIDAYKFIQHAQTNNVSDKFKKIAEGLKETDNPILVRVKLKSE